MTDVARCPSCGASVQRDDVSWCVQCYASLAPVPDPEPDPEPEVAVETGERPVLDGPEERPPAARPAEAEVAALADSMIAELAREQAPAGPLARLPASRRSGLVLALVGALVAAILLTVVLALIGLLL